LQAENEQIGTKKYKLREFLKDLLRPAKNFAIETLTSGEHRLASVKAVQHSETGSEQILIVKSK
jgi:hypothetical protein